MRVNGCGVGAGAGRRLLLLPDGSVQADGCSHCDCPRDVDARIRILRWYGRYPRCSCQASWASQRPLHFPGSLKLAVLPEVWAGRFP
jgi:hypothetical protein